MPCFSNSDPAEAVSFSYHASQAPYSIKVMRAGGNAAGLDITLFSFNHNLEHSVAASSLMDPANAHGAFTVGAVYQANWMQANPPIRPCSSQGSANDGRMKPELVAPDGTASLTCGVSSGTSFSAPTVAGAAALLLQEGLQQDAAILASRLQGEAIDVGAAGPDTVYGAGKLQLPLIDSDTDGLTDFEEDRTYATDPLAWDSDGDTVSDGAEVQAGTDPNIAFSFPGDGDLTEDGVVDVRDILLGLQYLQGLASLTISQQAHGDVTQDGIVNPCNLVLIQRRAPGLQ